MYVGCPGLKFFRPCMHLHSYNDNGSYPFFYRSETTVVIGYYVGGTSACTTRIVVVCYTL